jgi:hypothetical protein
MTKKRVQPHSILVATAWMMGTLFSFMAMTIGGRELSADLSTFQILFFRSLAGLIIVGGIACTTGLKQLSTNHLFTQPETSPIFEDNLAGFTVSPISP